MSSMGGKERGREELLPFGKFPYHRPHSGSLPYILKAAVKYLGPGWVRTIVWLVFCNAICAFKLLGLLRETTYTAIFGKVSSSHYFPCK